jgi:hypothetical protein
MMQDGEWANIILGSLEDVLPASSKGLTSVQAWTPVGKTLVIRRGQMGQHVRVPDSGAIRRTDHHGHPAARRTDWPSPIPRREDWRRGDGHARLIPSLAFDRERASRPVTYPVTNLC